MRTVSMLALAIVIWGCNWFTAPQNDKEKTSPMKLLWEIQYDFIGTAVNATPMLLGDSLVIMTAGRDLMAIEQLTGKIRWRTFVSDQTNLQTDEFATDGARLFGTHVEDIRAYDVSDGLLVWKITILDDRGGFWPNAMVHHDAKVFASGYRTVYALDGSTGNLLWKFALGGRWLLGDIVSFRDCIIVGGDSVVYDSRGAPVAKIARLYAFHQSTGELLWQRDMEGDGRGAAIVVDDSIAYTGSKFPFNSASFEAFRAESGERKWSYHTPNQGWDYNEVTLVGDKVIANAGPYHVAAFNKHTGQLLWRTFIVEDANAGKLHYYNGYVYHPHGIRIRILDPESGRVVYTLNGANENRLYTMAAGNGRIFVQGSRYLQCYEAYKP